MEFKRQNREIDMERESRMEIQKRSDSVWDRRFKDRQEMTMIKLKK